jgi:hypothetical protein
MGEKPPTQVLVRSMHTTRVAPPTAGHLWQPVIDLTMKMRTALRIRT